MQRRRFLTLTACALASPGLASPVTWSGFALGADVSLTFHTHPKRANAIIQAVILKLREIEAAFSLYDPSSEISRLNRSKHIVPSAMFYDVIIHASKVNTLTQGKFDPTVQTLWTALSQDHSTLPQCQWSDVSMASDRIDLPDTVNLTLNGIAQGYATDVIKDLVYSHGFDQVLINMGEFYGLGGPWGIGVSDPEHGLVHRLTLKDRAIATTSPKAMMITPTQGHVINPNGPSPAPWSTVSVTTSSATLADGLSTGFSLLPMSKIKTALANCPDQTMVTCVSEAGQVFIVGA